MSRNPFQSHAPRHHRVAVLAFALFVTTGCGPREPQRGATMASDSSAAADAAWGTVQAINRAWTVERSLDSLRPNLHQNMVGIYPNGERIEGSEAVLASYVGFFSSATVNWYREENPKVQVYGGGEFAVVSYVYDMEYANEGKTIATTGHEMYALVHEGGRWLVVAQQFQPLPGRPI